jgi:hypothetical protein
MRGCISNAEASLSSSEKIMNKSVLAAVALFAGAAIATPALTGFAADTEPQLAQTGPDQPGMGPGGMGRGGMMMAQMGPGQGMMRGGPGSEYFDEHFGEHRGPRGWMHRMMQMSPQQRCEEHLAKRAGVIAYVVAKLNLTNEQKPLWDKLQGILQTNADKERQLCAGLKPESARGQETMLDRLSRREQFLSTRLQGLQQAKPAVEQLYQALSPDQKAIVDHPFRRL